MLRRFKARKMDVHKGDVELGASFKPEQPLWPPVEAWVVTDRGMLLLSGRIGPFSVTLDIDTQGPLSKIPAPDLEIELFTPSTWKKGWYDNLKR